MQLNDVLSLLTPALDEVSNGVTLADARGDATPLEPIAAGDWDARKAAHLLDRAGFGGTVEEIAELAKMSPRLAVGRLVNYQAVTQDERLHDFEVQPYVAPPRTKAQTKYHVWSCIKCTDSKLLWL